MVPSIWQKVFFDLPSDLATYIMQAVHISTTCLNKIVLQHNASFIISLVKANSVFIQVRGIFLIFSCINLRRFSAVVSMSPAILGFYSRDATAMLVYKTMAKCHSSFA